MILVLRVTDAGTAVSLREKKTTERAIGLATRGKLLPILSRHLGKDALRRVSGIVLYYAGGTFSEVRAAGAVARTLGFALAIPVRTVGKLYAAPPHITKPKVEPIVEKRTITHRRFSS